MIKIKKISTLLALVSGIGTLCLVAILLIAYIGQARDQMIQREVNDARNLLLMTNAVLENMEKKWELGIFSPQVLLDIAKQNGSLKKEKVLATIPVVAAWNTSRSRAEKAGLGFRTPRFNARNKKNLPNAVEGQVLNYFKKNPKAQEKYVLDETINAVRYFRPVKLSKTCMNCHGDPATSKKLWGRDDGKDLTGYTMDNKHIGDMHGAFEVISPLAKAQAQLNKTILIALLITITVMIVILYITIRFVRHRVSQPLTGAVDVCKNVAKGDFRTEIDITSEDEIGQILASMEDMQSGLSHTVSQLFTGIEELKSLSYEVKSGSLDLSQRTEEQAGTVSQSSSRINEISDEVDETAQKVSSVTKLTRDISKEINLGGDKVLQVSEAMKQINDGTDQITQIISVIDEIAFQTNLLALNASVEAARAGDQGKGFAVVANEVRELAQRSANSAKEINDLINHNVEKVKQGSEIADESGEMMRSLVQSISTISDNIAAINQSASLQANSLKDLRNSLSEMDTITQQNTALVEELAASSELIDEKSSDMKESLSTFKTKDKK